MKIFCETCGEAIRPRSGYCFYCGSEAPARTGEGTLGKDALKNGVFCSDCGSKGPADGLFCGACGRSFYKKAGGPTFFCPLCCEKNSAEAVRCLACKNPFTEWFSLRGPAAEKAGFRGEMMLHEKMTGITSVFIIKKKISIGRSSANDIVIPSRWVSEKHACLDMGSLELRDLKSCNGTYVNKKSDAIASVPLHLITEFNISGSFTFSVVKKRNAFIFRLTEIIDEDQCNKNGDPAAYECLRNTYYILLNGDDELFLRKLDGRMDAAFDLSHESYAIKIENGYYYYSDPARGLDGVLLFSRKNNWPVNWKIL